jgi:hypothetical protein
MFRGVVERRRACFESYVGHGKEDSRDSKDPYAPPSELLLSGLGVARGHYISHAVPRLERIAASSSRGYYIGYTSFFYQCDNFVI